MNSTDINELLQVLEFEDAGLVLLQRPPWYVAGGETDRSVAVVHHIQD